MLKNFLSSFGQNGKVFAGGGGTKEFLVFSLLILYASPSKAVPVSSVNQGGNVTTQSLTTSSNTFSAEQTFTKILVTTNTSTFGNGTIRMGQTDDFGRAALHNFGVSSILKMGSSDADSGSDSDVDSEGIVVYFPSTDRAARIKADRFGLTLNSDQNQYYFRADRTELFFSTHTTGGNAGFGTNDPLAKLHVSGGVTGSGTKPSDLYSLAELQQSTPTVVGVLVIDSAAFDLWVGTGTANEGQWRNARTGNGP